MSGQKIGIISPYPEFSDVAKQLAREMKLDVIIRHGLLGKAVDIVQEWERKGKVEIVIARGETAATLKKHVTIPVVAVEITSFDIAEAICRAKSVGTEIALLDYERLPQRFDYDRIAGIVGAEFKTFLYRDEEQLDE
ncbi:MAG: PrpR N-terminal domain-containing protein, partial [Desulfofundulus sp.]